MLGWVCGDVCVWKPSEKAPLSGVACQNIIQGVLRANDVPEGIIGKEKVPITFRLVELINDILMFDISVGYPFIISIINMY
jgi:hypothetical protein